MFKLVNKILESTSHGFNVDMSDVLDPSDNADDIDDAENNKLIDNLRQYKYHPTTMKELVRSMVECYYDQQFRQSSTKQINELKGRDFNKMTIDFNSIDTSKITSLLNLSHYFGCYNYEKDNFDLNAFHWNGPVICSWSTQYDMKIYWSRAKSYNRRQTNWDVSGWDVHNVVDMRGAFSNLKNFNCDLKDWDVSKVKYMDFMFAGCMHFNTSLDCWGPLMSKIESMKYMLAGCKAYNQSLYSWKMLPANVHQSGIGDGMTYLGQFFFPVNKMIVGEKDSTIWVKELSNWLWSTQKDLD